MFKCNACGHIWSKGEKCPHCGSTEFENLEPIVEAETPEKTDDSTETDEEE